MNKDKAIAAAQEFCEAEGIGYRQMTPDDTANWMAKFLQSMIDQGKVLDAEKYSIQFHDAVKGMYAEGIEVGKLFGKSTVSSAGKEVKTLQECRDIVAKKMGYKDFSYMSSITTLTGMNEVAEMYAGQFKSSPASTPTDQEIRQESINRYTFDGEDFKQVECSRFGFIHGAKWYRDKLKQK